jgi:hypothetical protein
VETGDSGGDWTVKARQILGERMAAAASVPTTLLALCQSRLVTATHELARNLQETAALMDRMGKTQDQQTSIEQVSAVVDAQGSSLKDRLAELGIPDSALLDITQQPFEDNWGEMVHQEKLDLWVHLGSKREQLEKALREESAADEAERRERVARRNNWTPLMHEWLKMLADKGELRGIVEQIKGE